MTSAKEGYKKLNKELLSTYFKSQGWKESGYSWQFIHERSDTFIDVYVKPYYTCSDEEVKFLVTIDIADRHFTAWHSQLMKAYKQEQASAPDFIGEKIMNKDGEWIAKVERPILWTIKQDTDTQKLSQAIIRDVTTFIEPLLSGHATANSFIRELLNQSNKYKGKISGYKREYEKYDVHYYVLSFILSSY
ncbi:hypothetical protein CYG49_01725 [Candidatus Saccharibacteria bacterium]|nr:MAG: hypothetical protein CYG49_01725 [Candidatus Saccharibacteria bacterium]